jgi:hypothetical protein
MRLAISVAGIAVAAPDSARATVVADAPTADCVLQYFGDSENVSVRSLISSFWLAPASQTSLSVQWNNEYVVVPAVDAPPGTQAAVDAITTASRPISGDAYSDFAKTRNEVIGELTHRRTALTYYLSTEPDYLGQQVGLRHDRDFNDQSLNLSLGTSYGWDSITPLSDDDTQAAPAHKNTFHLNAVATQVLSPKTLLRLGAEYNLVEGLQHNPYRNVYAGGTPTPERHPDVRHRRDAFVNLSRYLGTRSSVKGTYRFYNDDWGITSHELGAQLNQYVTRGLFANYRYRFYTQSASYFYQEEYETTSGIDGYLSGDYRMSPLDSHLFGVGLEFDLGGVAFDKAVLHRMGLRFDYERYFNSFNYSANILTTKVVYRF